MRLSAAGRVVLATALLAALTSSCARPSPSVLPSPAAPAPRPSAQPVQPEPKIGALFPGGGPQHACSGAVLDSSGGDLILTAAHCVAEDVDTTFVPGFNNEAAPENSWHIDAVYLDPRWLHNQEPLADFAIARVSRESGGTIEAQAGGGLTLGSSPKAGTVVTVTGYPMGDGGGPIGCRAPTGPATHDFPSLPCEGMVDGLSGAPWITGSTITGLIGGLDGGGCQDESSYSPPFDDAISRLLARAEAAGPGDEAPSVFDDSCD
jgi:trypsin-like peptidase